MKEFLQVALYSILVAFIFCSVTTFVVVVLLGDRFNHSYCIGLFNGVSFGVVHMYYTMKGGNV